MAEREQPPVKAPAKDHRKKEDDQPPVKAPAKDHRKKEDEDTYWALKQPLERNQPPVKAPAKDQKKMDENLSEDWALKQPLERNQPPVKAPAKDQKKEDELLQGILGDCGDSFIKTVQFIDSLRGHSVSQSPVLFQDSYQHLNQQLELCVERAQEADPEKQKIALEILRNLTREIIQTEGKTADYLVKEIIKFYIEQNLENEAIDFCLKLMRRSDMKVHQFMSHIDRSHYARMCMYLVRVARHLPDQAEMMENLRIAHSVYMKFEDYPRALQIALYLDDRRRIEEIFTKCVDPLERQQLCFIVARQGHFKLDNLDMLEDGERDIINNKKLSEGYLILARDIKVMEPKSPGDIYKEHLIAGCGIGGGSVYSDLQDLAATFVNAFVNAGFGQDTLMTDPSKALSWVSRNKKYAKASTVASLGMICLWDVDFGLAQLDKYFYRNDNHAFAGALLGVGIVNCNNNVQKKGDDALAQLRAYICPGNKKYAKIKEEEMAINIGAIMGIGLAYAGSQNENVHLLLMPLLLSKESSLAVIAFAAIALGLVYVGSCHEDVTSDIIKALRRLNDDQLGDPLARFVPLGIGLLYLGKQEGAGRARLEVSAAAAEKIRRLCDMTLLSCAYAGTGNVLMVQHFLGQCADGESYQGTAVLGFAMVAMSEDVGLEMAISSLEHLLQSGEQNIRRAVPLALGLLCMSNPKVNVMDTLSRLSHDADSEVAMAATISLGLIGAGTNNARIAKMLCELSTCDNKDGSLLFSVRIAQGILNLGKGLLTLSPYHSERFLLSPTALSGLAIVLHALLDVKSVLGKDNMVLYYLVLAMQPRMLLTVDENLKPIPVSVRVGQDVDDFGQVARPTTKTHLTPIVLAAADRAELATNKYIPLSTILEGFVILKENPDFKEET